MKLKSWNGRKEIEFKSCPFCGCDPEINYIGNEHTKRRSIKVKCRSCRIARTDAALTHGFDWLEEIAAKNWNQRPVK